MRLQAILLSGILTALLLSGCGGGGAAAQPAATTGPSAAELRKAAELQWQVGLRAWRVALTSPVVAINGQMGSSESLDLLFQGKSAARSRLKTQLNKLRACSTIVSALGVAPASLRRARATAMSACVQFEASAEIVDIGVEAIRMGLDGDMLQSGLTGLGKGRKLAQKATTQSSGRPATDTTPVAAPEAPAIAATALGPAVTQRLRRAGYTVSATEPGFGKFAATEAREVPLTGGGGVTIYFYKSVADAKRSASTFTTLEREVPKQLKVVRIGANLYVGAIEEPAVLSVPSFDKLVEEAEGR